MIRVVDGLQKYHFPPLGVFACFCSHYESDNNQFFILCSKPGVKVLYPVDDTEI